MGDSSKLDQIESASEDKSKKIQSLSEKQLARTARAERRAATTNVSKFKKAHPDCKEKLARLSAIMQSYTKVDDSVRTIVTDPQTFKAENPDAYPFIINIVPIVHLALCPDSKPSVEIT
jgi:hypothetical protein